MSFTPDQSLLSSLPGKTAIVTGGANGIGLELVRQYHSHGANIVIADLPNSRPSAEAAIKTFGDDTRALFVPVNITIWEDVRRLFAAAIERFGKVDIVVANAGIMEERKFFDFDVDENGELRDDGAGRVIDVNLKGTMNTLKFAVFNMKENTPDENGWRGSVVLVSSTSGYLGGTEVISYISSKHGVIGLLRSSQAPAARLGIRVNCVAPFITPTHITAGYAAAWKAEGLPTNTPGDVATGITHMSIDTGMQGRCCVVVGGTYREIEQAVAASVSAWVGTELAEVFRKAGAFFRKLGGYPLPTARS
ncbi:Fc.00g049550.m01.CDS01 [Cosmosporella sp. VM-42]